MRSLLCTAGLAALVTASPASSGTTAHTQLCWSADGTTTTAFQNCSFGSTDASGHNAISLIQATPNPAGSAPDQVYSASASSTATPDTWRVAMTLGVSDYRRDMYILTEPDGEGPYIPTASSATATTTDSVTVTGGTGVYSLRYVFSLDGSVFSSDYNQIWASFYASLSMPSGSGGTTAYFTVGPGQTTPTSFTLSYADLPFGGPVEPTLTIGVSGSVNAIHAAEVDTIGADTITAYAAAQFGSTVHLTSLLVTDASGAPIPGLQLSSANGYSYPVDPSFITQVPEPSSTWLMLLGGLVLFGALRRSAARSG